MNSRDRKKLARYKWLFRHPIFMHVLMAALTILYFAVTTLVETAHKTALNICAILPLGLLFVIYFGLEIQGGRTLQRLIEQDIPVSVLLQIYENLYAGIDFTKRRNVDTYRDYVLAAAPLYTLLGEFDRATGLYRDFLSASNARKTEQKVYRMLLLSDLADCLAEKGDFDGARRAMHDADELSQKLFKRSRKKQRTAENELNALTRAKIELKHGNPAPMAAILADAPSPEKTRVPTERLSLTRLHGLTAFVQGNCEKAERAFTYVQAHGKDTFYVQEAKYYLDKIREHHAN